ncbi:polyhydroxyalkanoate biosynthesis repressor PhaR [Bacillus sp. V5-8f]|uniref:polyhydroxyalkanoate biosynthesis repressor PhaR n=1 Tax=Bacillus sp. V5-8f TaxID=2053044 RepID=UPI000C7766F3|nr:polyhydroxyalkanoate biosynthesis repressor PhaR [Bacillus sp. V5-8f]PLT33274.1 polyhydroxyalkanoate biosynthesis repressor PhaR [Bacillus sp. V5-8f]
MSNDKKYDPYKGFRQLSEMWEQQMNGVLSTFTDTNEFVKASKIGMDSHSRYMELFRKNQELIASYMNLPTKKDIANVAQLSIQAEDKIDLLEEQIWEMKDEFISINKENMEFFEEIVKVTKQLKTELSKTAKELAETKKMNASLQKLSEGLADTKNMKAELQALREELAHTNSVQAELQELKLELMESNDIKAELQDLKQELVQFAEIKNQLAQLKNMDVKEKEEEAALVGVGAGK